MIQLTGWDALSLVTAIFRGKKNADLARAAGRLQYGHLVKGEEILDEVLVAVVDAQAEGQTVEINCHGGVVAVERVMAELEARGAERVPAAALLGPQLDAVQREAAMAIPRAQSRLAVRMLLEQYDGELSRELRRIAQMLPCEAASALGRLRATARLGMALCVPKRVVIVGPPNAGKSTLFNTILGHSRAIVTDIPGTTRDFLSEVVVIGGVPFELIDTAGLRDSDHHIEREGIRLSYERISAADVVVFIFDAALPSDGKDEQLPAEPARPSAPVLVAANKVDLLRGSSGPDPARADVWISAEKGTGVEDLEARIVNAAVGTASYSGGPALFTQRQLELVAAAEETARRNEESFREKLLAIMQRQE